jgi:hypothetical protein
MIRQKLNKEGRFGGSGYTESQTRAVTMIVVLCVSVMEVLFVPVIVALNSLNL